jgi:hypothetical protein
MKYKRLNEAILKNFSVAQTRILQAQPNFPTTHDSILYLGSMSRGSHARIVQRGNLIRHLGCQKFQAFQVTTLGCLVKWRLSVAIFSYA